MVKITKTLAVAIAAAGIALMGCQLNPSADCPNGDDCDNLIVTPGNIEVPCGGACGAGQECLDPSLNACPCEPTGMVGNTCVDYSATCSCQAPAVCGNGVIEASETCDDGNVVGGDGCSATCVVESCGNLVLDVGEDCDDGGANTALCDSDCTFPLCGDGIANSLAGEGCDDGNTTAGDGCSGVCQLESCGNSVIDLGEVCDDGNTADLDGCSADCMSDETCGNSYLDATTGEDCDDGGESATCNADCSAHACGDGVLNATAGELCDDGNVLAGDGCGPTCLTEVCGNGVLDPGEECDDGNVLAADGCGPTCLFEIEDCATPGDDDFDGLINCEDEDCRTAAICICATMRIAMVNEARVDIRTSSPLTEHWGWDAPAGNWYDLSFSQYDNGARVYIRASQLSAMNTGATLCYYTTGVAWETTPTSVCQSIPLGGSINRSTGAIEENYTFDVAACTAP